MVLIRQYNIDIEETDRNIKFSQDIIKANLLFWSGNRRLF